MPADRFARPLLVAAFVLGSTCLPLSAQEGGAKKAAPKATGPLARVAEVQGLPRVLLIGDSISIGYTVATRTQLAGAANVQRIPANGGPTTNGLANLDRWLGEEKWDVIHFNWGLHDLKHVDDKRQVSPEDYEKNLRMLVARLKKTGAVLVWCSTTPVPEKVTPHRTDEDVLLYNRLAAKIMSEEGVRTDDLYTFAAGRLAEIQQPNNVHFSPKGSEVLAEQVAKSIREALAARAGK